MKAPDDSAAVALLGAILVRNEAMDDLADLLAPGHFRRQHHGQIFAAMLALHRAGTPIDLVTLADEMRREGTLDAVGLPFLASLGEGVPRSANVLYYAQQVREQALYRELGRLGKWVTSEAESAQVKAAQLLEQAEAKVYALGSAAVKTEWVFGAELASDLYQQIEKLTPETGGITGLQTGFRKLDWMTRGFQKGDLILLGARPSVGKTAWMLQVAMQAAQTVPVAVFSIEMGKDALSMRAVIGEAQVDGWRFMSGHGSEADMARVSHGLSVLGQSKVAVLEVPMLSPVLARSMLRRLQARVGTIGLVTIDYLQLMEKLPEHRSENRATQVAGISRALKILAREFGCPFLVLSQLNREVEKGANRRPNLSDLRESGALEQDADVVMLLHRPTSDPAPGEAAEVELIVAKQRNGPTGAINLIWRGPQMRFENAYQDRD